MMGMQFNAVTLDSSLKLIEYCSSNNVSLEEVSRSRKIAEYEVDVMKIFGFCKKLGWLEDSGGEISITQKASEILILEKPPEMLRRMLDMVFNSQDVFWRRFLSRGRKEAKFFLEGNQLQVLEWCGLFEEGDHISDWWLDQRTYSNEEEEIQIDEFSLAQNYPNPFNPNTQINFSLPQSGQVQLRVYNMLGQQVSVLVDERRNAGAHSIRFNASVLASGVYVYELRFNGSVLTNKMILLK